MKRLTSMMLCSTLLLGLISNSSVLNSYAEEDQAIIAYQSDKEAKMTENQVKQENNPTTETTNDEKPTTESNSSEFVKDSGENTNNDLPKTENKSTDESSSFSKKKAAKAVLAVTPNQATTKDEQVFNLEDINYSLDISNSSITLTGYHGSKTDLVIPSKINYQGKEFSVKVKIENLNASALFPTNVHSITFVSVDNTKVKIENNTADGVTLDHLFAVRNQTYPNLTSIDFSGLDMDNVTSLFAAFNGGFIPNLTTLNFGQNKLPNVTNMKLAFNHLKNLTTIEQQWTFGKLTNMNQMFAMETDQTNLTTIGDTSTWNTSTVTDMSQLFLNCSKLQALDLSTWDVSKVTTMESMFFNCPALTSIGNTGSWNVSKVTNFSKMFNDCISLTEIRMDNWQLNQNAQLSYMFYLASLGYNPLPALIVASDEKLLNYSYADVGYKPKCEIRINANGGNLVKNPYWSRAYQRNTDISYYFYQIAIPTETYNTLKLLNGEQLQEKVEEWLESNVPTKTDYALTGWAPTDQAFEQKIQSITDFDTFMSSKEEFKANWVSDKFNTSPDNTKLNPTGSLSLAYYPTAFTINSADLQSSGEQKIPISKQVSLNLGIKDRTRTRDTWIVTAQLTWNGNRLPNAYITADNSTVTENISTGSGSYSPSTDLKALSDNSITGTPNYKINSNANPIMESNGTMVNNGVYDFNLGNAVLVIPEVSQVAVGNYQGEVHWNLTIGPN
ncbi:BspA family leucine-rich repeat surface protein [Enterococcus casseliflavus]|uniref:BspA family leucine-rich repeat surface protein n=1 Tax=Enterococcus casseliflavus TaxID=37734 RepID=UPI002DB5BAEB|nr:BspA family leucine-rich repeat surface protein [Enterococcus casseliflavus]MEB8418496.1 BspA family leucine-rich repeat surface protein [Enterococcus casseliflavus]